MICGFALHRLTMTTRPVNSEVRGGRAPEPEMKPHVICRIKARLACDRLGLHFSTIVHYDPRPYCAAIGHCTNEPYFQPVTVPADVVPQQGRGLIHVHNQDVDITIIIKVPESAAPA